MNPYRLKLKLSGLPKMTNRRTHWSVLMNEGKKWKGLIGWETRTTKPKKPLKKSDLTLTRCSSIRPDYDGLVSGFKKIIDGLTVNRIIEDDSPDHISVSYRWEKAARGKGGVIIEILERNN